LLPPDLIHPSSFLLLLSCLSPPQDPILRVVSHGHAPCLRMRNLRFHFRLHTLPLQLQPPLAVRPSIHPAIPLRRSAARSFESLLTHVQIAAPAPLRNRNRNPCHGRLHPQLRLRLPQRASEHAHPLHPIAIVEENLLRVAGGWVCMMMAGKEGSVDVGGPAPGASAGAGMHASGGGAMSGGGASGATHDHRPRPRPISLYSIPSRRTTVTVCFCTISFFLSTLVVSTVY
jgi:hypothetical protein